MSIRDKKGRKTGQKNKAVRNRRQNERLWSGKNQAMSFLGRRASFRSWSLYANRTQRSWTMPARNRSALVVRTLEDLRLEIPKVSFKELIERSTQVRRLYI